jgi:zinc/manganese transport system ATP-binding protein
VLGRAPGETSRQIGYLPQRRSFDASLRMRGVDIVRLGLDGTRWGFPLLQRRAARRAAAARVRELVELVGAQAYAFRPIGELSGGEQQRLLIAQALAHRPSLLLLDEPLDSLDLPTQASVAALLSDICQREGVTVMIVAHDVNPILSQLDRVIYVAQGSALQGSPEEIITSETLSRLYGTPVEVLTTSTGALVVVGQPDTGVTHHHHGDEAHA